ncbi:MAG: hypothetical protein HYS05_00520 [Acidobacteria bacterium]|nr:hypothetical protein [Acidobacteriota bacterium]
MTRQVILLLLVTATTAAADTLYLRNGQRVRGEIRSIRNGVIEFEEDRGFRGTRTLRLNRDEVARIDLDEDQPAPGFSSPGGSGRPAGLRERETSVAATIAWTDTGVDVRSGQTIYFSATGRIAWGPGRRDGPAGESGSPHNAGRPIPSRPAAGLIGKIGNDSTDYFFVGDDKGAIRMRASGRLFLGVNDDFLQDNSGSFRVTVYY